LDHEDLVDAIRRKRAILFVGAGVSKNVGVPTSGEIVNEIARQLGYDPQEFRGLADHRSLAEFYLLTKGTLGPLRSWMDVTWHRQDVDVKDSVIHRLIVELSFPIIYTTNYDRWLERAFEAYGKEYSKITNVGDLLKARDGVTQIVKFHGDFDDDESIVLTESGFFERLDFESALDLKLQADVLGRPVLFIGYSLSDINIRYLVYKLQRLWEASKLSQLRPKSYVFLGGANPVQERVLRRRGIEPIVSECENPGEGLSRFLCGLLERVTAK
jgi:SIR2-like domain